MKRAGLGIFRVFLILLGGLVIGSIAGDLLSRFSVPYMNTFVTRVWHPAADLGVIQYNLTLTFRLNAMSLVGVALAYWLMKKF